MGYSGVNLGDVKLVDAGKVVFNVQFRHAGM